MDKEDEKRILNYNAMNTLAELNFHFGKCETMTLDTFMEIQQRVWKETKEAFGVKL